MIRFFTSWYNEKNEARREELIFCLKQCCDSPDIDKVYVYAESPVPFLHEKLIENQTFSRPTYNDFFLLANAVSEEGDVVIVSNTDIYPAPNIRALLETLEPDCAWALSRWDIQREGTPIHHCRKDSQDEWVFRTPIKPINGNFHMGIAGCDNAIACWIEQAGYKISNPSKDVKFYHYHLTGVHNYNPNHPVKAPYLLIEPSYLSDTTSEKHLVSWQPTSQNPLTPHTRG